MSHYNRLGSPRLGSLYSIPVLNNPMTSMSLSCWINATHRQNSDPGEGEPVFPESTRSCAHVWRSITASKGVRRVDHTTESHEGRCFCFVFLRKLCTFFPSSPSSEKNHIDCLAVSAAAGRRTQIDLWNLYLLPCRGKLAVFGNRSDSSELSHNSTQLRVGLSSGRKATPLCVQNRLVVKSNELNNFF